VKALAWPAADSHAPRRSLRLRLTLVMLWGLLPALLATQWTVLRYREDALDENRETLRSIADLAAVSLHGEVVQVETLLLSLAQTPTVLGRDPNACRSFLRNVRAQSPQFTRLGVIGINGLVRCDTDATAGTASGNQDYLNRALQQRQLSIGGYGAAPGQRQALAFAYPVLGADGAPQGVIYAELSLNAIDALCAELRLPPAIRMAVIDRRTMVLSSTAPQRFAQGTPADPRLPQAPRLATMELPPDQSSNRWYAAVAQVPGLPAGDLSVIVESSRAEQASASYSEMRRVLALLLAALPPFFGFVWYRARHHVFMPLDELVTTAKRIADGHLEARVLRRATSAEMYQLSAAVNRMAQTLAERIRELQRAETRYRELFEHAVEGLFQADAEGRLMLVNLALTDMLGYLTPGQVLSERAGLLHEAARDSQIGLKLIDQLRQSGTVRTFETVLRRADGGQVWVSASVRLVRGAGNTVSGYEGSVKDVTARHKAEQAMRALNAELEQRIEQRTQELAGREALYRTLTEAAPQIIWRADQTGRITYLNPAWTEMSGCSISESLGFNWMALVHPDDLAGMRKLWAKARHSLQEVRCELRFRTRSSRYATFYCVAVPVRDGNQAPCEWVGINTDISAHKQAAEALEISNRELEAFSYSVSHDLRAPLHTIEGFSHALLAQYGASLEGKARHYLERISHGTRTMGALIEHLLALARVTRSKLEPVTVDLSALARQAIAALREEEPERKVEVQIADGLITSGSPQLLGLAMSNLLQNAWKYTRNTAEARIEVDMQATAAGRIFVVRDNGVGFDMRYAGKLFAPFQRLHTQGEFPGSGVGLAIVKRVMLRHHGDIWVQAAPGAGASFYFSLWVREM
jgi:PAS domain S-box-containing protein